MTNYYSYSSLPSGWELKSLGDVGIIYSGGTPSTSDQTNFDGEIPWITPADLSGYKSKKISRGRRNITKKGLKSSSATLVPSGSVLFSSRAPIGYVVIAENEVTTNQGFKTIAPYECIKSDYLYYYLKSIKKFAEEQASGTTFLEISKSKFSSLPIPLPPLDEQQRIVARIEELFTQLDAGVAALEAVRAQVRRYRQAVLQAAVTGRLSTSWRKKQYDENGGVSIDGSLPTGWKNETLGNLGRVIGGLTKNQKRDHFPMRLPYISVGNVYANELRLEEVNEIGVLENELERILLKKDDLLVVEGNGSPDQIGRAALWDGSIDPCVHQNHIIKVRLEHPEMGRFIMLWLLSTSGREKIKKLASSTSGLYTLSISKVASIPVTLPPIEEQNVIISEVERRISVVDQMDKTIEIALRQAARLRQSILQRAFTGRL